MQAPRVTMRHYVIIIAHLAPRKPKFERPSARRKPAEHTEHRRPRYGRVLPVHQAVHLRRRWMIQRFERVVYDLLLFRLPFLHFFKPLIEIEY